MAGNWPLAREHYERSLSLGMPPGSANWQEAALGAALLECELGRQNLEEFIQYIAQRKNEFGTQL